MAQQITISDIIVGVVSQTITGVEGALDVDVTVTLSDGTEHEGEVTLVRDRGHATAWRAYGDEPSMWVEAGLLAALDRCADRRTALGELAECTAMAAERYDTDGAQPEPRPTGRTSDQW